MLRAFASPRTGPPAPRALLDIGSTGMDPYHARASPQDEDGQPDSPLPPRAGGAAASGAPLRRTPYLWPYRCRCPMRVTPPHWHLRPRARGFGPDPPRAQRARKVHNHWQTYRGKGPAAIRPSRPCRWDGRLHMTGPQRPRLPHMSPGSWAGRPSRDIGRAAPVRLLPRRLGVCGSTRRTVLRAVPGASPTAAALDTLHACQALHCGLLAGQVVVMML